MSILALLLTTFNFSCTTDKKPNAFINQVEIQGMTSPKLDINAIKKNATGLKGVYDFSTINVGALNRVDSLTLSLLPGMPQQVSGEDYLYFYDFIEHNDFGLLTVVNGNQFGDFLEIFAISRSKGEVVGNASVALNGAEDTWSGTAKGIWNNGRYRFELVNQTDSAGYSEDEFTRRIDSIRIELIPRSGQFEKNVLSSTRSVERIKTRK